MYMYMYVYVYVYVHVCVCVHVYVYVYVYMYMYMYVFVTTYFQSSLCYCQMRMSLRTNKVKTRSQPVILLECDEALGGRVGGNFSPRGSYLAEIFFLSHSPFPFIPDYEVSWLFLLYPSFMMYWPIPVPNNRVN